MKIEEWKDIPGYEGFYQVSNLGRVKSLPRKGSRRLNILKPKVQCGRFKLHIYKDGIRKGIYVHQLVAMAFLGHRPCGYKAVVDHIDNNPFNNNVDNLQITTARHNSSKDKKNKTSKYTGVRWKSANKKWVAEIHYKGKKHHLGYFECELKAHLTYQNKLKSIQNEL